MTNKAPHIRPRVTLEEVFGPGCVFNPRASFSGYGWLPEDVAVLDAMTGGALAVTGKLPTICSRAVVTAPGLDLLARAGLPSSPDTLTYGTEAEYLACLSKAASASRQVALSHLHPEAEIPRESYWIDPGLLSFLNNKANLGILVPSEAVPQRCLMSPGELRALGRTSHRAPRVIKAASNLSSGGGVDVVLTYAPEDVERARRRFQDCDQVVVEEFLPIERNLCVNYAAAGERIIYLGTAEQVTSPQGGYLGNWLHRRHQPPAQAVDLGREIMRRASARGYRGIGGFDMALLPDGRVKVFDLNFRINGCTPALLLSDAVFMAYGKPLLGRLQTWTTAGSFEALCAIARRAVQDRYLLPLSTYDPAAGPCSRASPRLSGLLLGESREEVHAKQQYLANQGLVPKKASRDARFPSTGVAWQKAA